jgi:hypothetical protein
MKIKGGKLPMVIGRGRRRERLNSEMIWKIWKKSKSNSDKIWTTWKKGKLKCEMI